jgi:hypothetical protein
LYFFSLRVLQLFKKFSYFLFSLFIKNCPQVIWYTQVLSTGMIDAAGFLTLKSKADNSDQQRLKEALTIPPGTALLVCLQARLLVVDGNGNAMLRESLVCPAF